MHAWCSEWNMQLKFKSGENGFYIDDIMSVDNQFFEVFSLDFVSGKSTSPFVNLQSAVITESTAKTLFGAEDPVGKNLLIMGSHSVTIMAVIKDFPENSSIAAGLLVNADNKNFKFPFSCGDYMDESSHRWPFRIYLQLNDNVNPDILAAKINSNNNLLEPYNEEINF